MNSMLREAIWTRDAYVPTINEYMENAYVSFALGPIVLPAIYLVGPKLSEEIIESSEYHYLFELMSTQGRLLNDIHSFKVYVYKLRNLLKILHQFVQFLQFSTENRLFNCLSILIKIMDFVKCYCRGSLRKES